jgi:hypothetical protein
MISKGLVHSIAGADLVVVEHHQYGSGLPFDLYRPDGVARRPAVVFTIGIPDPGAIAVFGAPFKDFASYREWARLVAASGLVAITYQNQTPADVSALLAHLRAHGHELGLDGRIAIWAASGHGPQALAVIASEAVTCAVLLYPYTLDVAEQAAAMHFAAPPMTLDELPAIPLLVVRAGADTTPALNDRLDAFVAGARARGLPVEQIDHPGAHAFDILDDSPRSREVIEEVLAFLRRQLQV